MRFLHSNDLHAVIYITGPRHYYLGLVFGVAPGEGPEVVAKSNGGPSGLDGEQVMVEVRNGIADAARHLNRDIHVQRILYYLDDTPPESEFRRLANALVMHVFGDSVSV